MEILSLDVDYERDFSFLLGKCAILVEHIRTVVLHCQQKNSKKILWYNMQIMDYNQVIYFYIDRILYR